MTRLAILALLAVDNQVVPCGSALCIGGNQQPITLGNTAQVSQGSWPDGGIAEWTPVVPGAIVSLAGTQSDPNDGGTTTTPDVVLRGRNSRSAADPIVSVRSNTVEVARVGLNASFGRLLDGGSQTATVPSGTHCVCNDITDVTKGSKAVVSSTTATLSGTTGDSLACLCL